MEPNVRRLLQVQIDDVIEADQVFTMLTGNEVRWDFIATIALATSCASCWVQVLAYTIGDARPFSYTRAAEQSRKTEGSEWIRNFPNR